MKKEILVKTLFSALLLAMALGGIAGCASRTPADGDRSTITGGSGVTVFGVIDAAVSGSKNR